MERVQATTGKIRKRKAENQDNERLSKRLSLLNLERNGQKLYVPVEQPTVIVTPPPRTQQSSKTQNDDIMQVDDTKHKVYIYDLDAELSDSESSDDGKLVFLPDIEKHLRESRIPPSIFANSEGELAGNNQLVLYNVPSSLTIPEEHDSVRKAIIETRARARAKQREKREADTRGIQTVDASIYNGVDTHDWYHTMAIGKATMTVPAAKVVLNGNPRGFQNTVADDLDAMDLG